MVFTVLLSCWHFCTFVHTVRRNIVLPQTACMNKWWSSGYITKHKKNTPLYWLVLRIAILLLVVIILYLILKNDLFISAFLLLSSSSLFYSSITPLPISPWDKLVSLYREISVMVCRFQTASTNEAGAHSSWIWQKFHMQAHVFLSQGKNIYWMRLIQKFKTWNQLWIFYPLHLSWNNEWTYWLFDLKSTMLLLYWGKVCT